MPKHKGRLKFRDLGDIDAQRNRTRESHHRNRDSHNLAKGGDRCVKCGHYFLRLAYHKNHCTGKP